MRALVPVLVLVAAPAFGATITINPSDSFAKIEAAQAGDIVEIAPGTYKFRVDLNNAGTASQPIVLRAQVPNNRPVWDLTGTPVSSAPGSSTAGDKGRGCWQIRAGHYVVDGIVFKGCTDESSAGVRVVNVPDVTLRNCTFINNTNGVTGAGDPLTIEFSEFNGNGTPFMAGDSPAHQIYIYGGTLEVRFSYFHDSPMGQDFHVRARDATLEYNWITRPGSYLGDLMTCEYLCGSTGTMPITQRMLLRGNVLVQSMPQNHSQLIALDSDGTNADGTGQVSEMDLTMVSNTVVGTSGFNNVVVHSVNDTVATQVHLTDNIITNVKQANLVDDVALGNTVLDGSGNWATSGTDVGNLSGTHFGADPMLSSSYVPLPGSPVIGTAVNPGALAPTFEYYKDETITLEGRTRATVNDPGAFESTTMSPPFDGQGGGLDGGTSGPDASSGGGVMPPVSGGGGSTGTYGTAGCTCDVAHGAPTLAWMVVLCVAALLLRRRA